jgi:hypothetical protein
VLRQLESLRQAWQHLLPVQQRGLVRRPEQGQRLEPAQEREQRLPACHKQK